MPAARAPGVSIATTSQDSVTLMVGSGRYDFTVAAS
jgi:hypothetical protein